MRLCEISDGGTYGAAIEVPEMVLESILDSIQAEVTSTPRNQTGTGSGMAAVWRGEGERTIDGFTKVGEVSLGFAAVNCSWSSYISVVIGQSLWNSTHPQCWH